MPIQFKDQYLNCFIYPNYIRHVYLYILFHHARRYVLVSASYETASVSAQSIIYAVQNRRAFVRVCDAIRLVPIRLMTDGSLRSCWDAQQSSGWRCCL